MFQLMSIVPGWPPDSGTNELQRKNTMFTHEFVMLQGQVRTILTVTSTIYSLIALKCVRLPTNHLVWQIADDSLNSPNFISTKLSIIW